MSHATDQLLRKMWQKGGVVLRVRGARSLCIHPRGDRRTRPLAWIDAVDAQAWLDAGILQVTPRGLALSDEVIHRLRHGQTPREVQDGMQAARRAAQRPARPLPPVETFDRLLDSGGRRVFTDAQVRAARSFARDLRRAGHGADGIGPATSDLAQPHVDGTRRHDRAEDAAIRRVDAGRAVARAKRGMDRRVARTLTRVIGAEETFEALDAGQGWGEGVGAMLMKIGLDQLVTHYGIR